MALVFLGIFIAVAVRCPDTTIGRWVQAHLISPTLRWLMDVTWRRALIGIGVSAVTIGVLMVAPEFVAVISAVDMTIVAELALLAALNATRIRWTRTVDTLKAYGLRQLAKLKTTPRSRALRRQKKPRPTKPDASDGDAGTFGNGAALA